MFRHTHTHALKTGLHQANANYPKNAQQSVLIRLIPQTYRNRTLTLAAHLRRQLSPSLPEACLSRAA